MGAYAWAGAVLLRAAVLHAGRQLAARRRRRSCSRACSPAARWSATTRSSSTSPPRTSATTSPRAAGRSATSAAACCWPSTSPCSSATTRSGSSEGMAGPALAAVGGDLVGRLHDHPDGPAAQLRPAQRGARPRARLFQRSFGQLFTTLKEMRGFPMTLTFLIAYLFYNDGIQTVIYAASTYGSKQLKFGQSVLIAHDPADPVRRVRRRALLRAARGQARRLPRRSSGASTPGW